MQKLAGKVALVTGASRGIGKGIALGLGEAGATIYITGRTVEAGHAAVNLPGTLGQTVAEVEQLGATCIPIRCDHGNDDEVRAVFEQIHQEQGRLDILVNNVWGGYEHFNADPYLMQKSGQVLIAAQVALDYGFTDIDGKQPQPEWVDK